MDTRRNFIKKAAAGSAALAIGGMGFSAKSYGNIIGANERIQVAVLGFSNRFKDSLGPSFLKHAEMMRFDLSVVCDIWDRRRKEGFEWIKAKTGKDVFLARNTDELWEMKPDAVIISTADFQHALLLAEAVEAGCDVYCEKPFAETMDDAILALKAAHKAGKVIQIGSQRRSGPNYQAAADYIQSGNFGNITMVEMTWNVNQPGRWRLPSLITSIQETDTDWKRFLMNRPFEPWDPRKYCEYRLFWPYSSGIPGQWMSHQIDTVHWFSKLPHPRSVAANGGIYMWKDGRKNNDTMTAVFDYGPFDNLNEGFQVLYTSRMHNSSGGTKEWYFSNGGKLDLDSNKVTSEGGLQEGDAAAMKMKPNLLQPFELPQFKAEAGVSMGSDPLTDAHMQNWMQCVRDQNLHTNAPVEVGFNHSIANIMVTASLHTGQKAVFDRGTQQVMAGGKIFKY
jgi:predicted dehydrogenase